jgi:tRNA threonylcarbamoyladenosine biosynthesis protein TsaB
MRVIALDTTTSAGSVALVADGRIVEERAGDSSRSHAERLPGDILALARSHRVALADVDLFAVASGPGSFTGLRIGIATAQGLAAVHRRRIVGVSTLDALAHAAGASAPAGCVIAAWMDAHRHTVFAAIYEVTGAEPFHADRLKTLDGPGVDEPSPMLERWIATLGTRPDTFVGDGALLYESEIRRAAPDARVAGHPMLAGTIGMLASAGAVRAVEPGDIRPLYVRRPDAEIARDAR